MSATFSDISGMAPNRLPDVPLNSLQIDPGNAQTMYVGSDIGVFRTTDGGANWVSFNNGLPNTAVYDLKLHAPTNRLRAATHGRGMWERRLGPGATPNVELYLRDHLMHTANAPPATTAGTAAAFSDVGQSVALGSDLWWWMCADAKVDSLEGMPPDYQLPVAQVDYVAFESRLVHRNPKRGEVNRVYVQVHNRGLSLAAGVVVKALYAAATPSLPNLPADFWTQFPGDSLDPASEWHPIGTFKTAPPVLPTQPLVLEWDWTPPLSQPEHTCLLVVVDSPADPIPTASRVTDTFQLITSERHVGLRNLHVVDAGQQGPGPILAELLMRIGGRRDLLRIPRLPAGWSAGLVLPERAAKGLKGEGFERVRLTKELRAALRAEQKRWEQTGRGKDPIFTSPVALAFERRGAAALSGLSAGRRGYTSFLTFQPGRRAAETTMTIMQESKSAVVGGNTFVLRPRAR
jgi:hypothetical protein